MKNLILILFVFASGWLYPHTLDKGRIPQPRSDTAHVIRFCQPHLESLKNVFKNDTALFYLHDREPSAAIIGDLLAIAQEGRSDSVILIDNIRMYQDSLYPEKTENSPLLGLPLLKEIIDALLQINCKYKICFLGDTLLAFPEDAGVSVSPVVSACALHRLAPFCPEISDIDLQTADFIIGRAAHDERAALISYYEVFAPIDLTYGYQSYALLWYGLIQKHLGYTQEADSLLRVAKQNSLPGWRLNPIVKPDLVSHVQACLDKAEYQTSSLSEEVLEIEGMSSAQIRHFLNNVCSLPQTSYLEVGCWKGSTLIASLYRNRSSVIQAVAVDDWSEFGAPRQAFLDNVNHFLPLANRSLKIFEADAFTLNTQTTFPHPVTIYFYDGNHDRESHERAFTYFNDVFADTFIAIVDDWNWPWVQEGTRSAFQKLGYTLLFERELFTPQNSCAFSWWNGLYVAVIQKSGCL